MRKILIVSMVLVLSVAAVGWLLFRTKSTSIPENNEVPSTTKDKQVVDPNEHDFMDVDFARKMIVHNQQGIQIADMAKERAVKEDVRQMATGISKELSTETQQYISWLTEWKETYFNLSDFPEMEGHDMYPTHPGMASLGQLDQLRTATGGAVDEQFLSLMIKHHEGANEMANSIAFEKIQFGQMIDLKARFLKRQTDEVQTMKRLQTNGG